MLLSRRHTLSLGLGIGAERLLSRSISFAHAQNSSQNHTAASGPKTKVGVNVAGAEFGDLEGKKNFQYVYADNNYINWCLDQGFTIIRLPFSWPRLMPSIDDRALRMGDFEEVQRIAKVCTARGAVCLLDMHNYGRYRGKPLGYQSIPTEFFALTWQLIAAGLQGQNVWFGLMNEPHDQDMDKAMAQFQMAADAIRKTGHIGRILVPSGGWSGAHAFVGGGNVPRFQSLKIPGDWSVELHQYLDANNSGTNHSVHVAGKGASILKECTAALAENNWTAILGELGWSDSADGNREGEDLVSSMHQRPDVWIAHTYWSSGPWWGDYPYAIGPNKKNGQLSVLQKFM